MVLLILKYGVRPEKAEAYIKWTTESAVPRELGAW